MTQNTKPTIVFMGTPAFALESLKALYQQGYPILAVYSQPDKPAGRGNKLTQPPCAQFAQEHHLPLFQPAKVKDPQVIRHIQQLAPDFIVVVAYGFFLPSEILNAAKIAPLNVHASLLPAYRGAAPIQWALIRGESQTGISIIRITPQMDAGPVYATQSLPIDQGDSAKTLFEKLAALGASLLIKTLPSVADGSLKAQPQNDAGSTLAPLLKKEDGRLDWNKPAQTLKHLIQGVTPWPGAYTTIDNKSLKIYDALALDESVKTTPGTLYLISPQGLHVACSEGTLLIQEVQLEGKKRMNALDFANGYRLKPGIQLI